MKREEFEKYAEENGLVVVSKEQYDKAKKALEQPCEDCVSRKAVLNTLFYKSDNNCEVVLNKELQDRVKALPSVTPAQKWIPVSERLPKEEGKYITTILWLNNNFIYTVEVALALFDGVSFKAQVLAWMPLPLPYKGDKKDD